MAVAVAQVPMEVVGEERVQEIRRRILDGIAHPADVSWVAAEAARLLVVRSNLLAEVKTLRDAGQRLMDTARQRLDKMGGKPHTRLLSLYDLTGLEKALKEA